MNFAELPLVQAMKTRLNYASARAGVLAQNVANADTPGYRAKDIAPPNFKQALANAASQQLPMASTSAAHLSSKAAAHKGYSTHERASTYEQSPTGNNVTVEEEMQRIAMNQSEYQRALLLYRKTVSMFRTALGSQNAGG